VSPSLIRLLRRCAAVAILLLLPLVAWIAVAQPLIGMVSDRQAQIDTLSDRLARLQAAIRRIPRLKESEAANKQRLEAMGGIWTDTSEAAIAAIMQDRLRQAVSSSKGVVKSASHLRGASEKDLETVRIRFTIEGTLATVQQTLTAIDDARPAMFVDSMTISAPAAFPPDRAPVLGLDIEIVGYMRPQQ
jgi:uncharacterized membrane protein affecting hemolysin expression